MRGAKGEGRRERGERRAGEGRVGEGRLNFYPYSVSFRLPCLLTQSGRRLPLAFQQVIDIFDVIERIVDKKIEFRD